MDWGPNIQVSADRGTMWVHSSDGSTVGRFSKKFGMDIHNTVTAQMSGKPQCLHCTHEPATEAHWHEFTALIEQHFNVHVPTDIMQFEHEGTAEHPRPRVG